MDKQDEEQLKLEIQHIFDSGANEIRIFEMVKAFIIRRQEKQNREIINSIGNKTVRELSRDLFAH